MQGQHDEFSFPRFGYPGCGRPAPHQPFHDQPRSARPGRRVSAGGSGHAAKTAAADGPTTGGTGNNA
ncbi:hypothetical protein NY78_2020 [Desulfovibrio sp. TomC]|nr:hypothetical protein NY78_2020 [Desulfovibrio sp. TomC]